MKRSVLFNNLILAIIVVNVLFLFFQVKLYFQARTIESESRKLSPISTSYSENSRYSSILSPYAITENQIQQAGIYLTGEAKKFNIHLTELMVMDPSSSIETMLDDGHRYFVLPVQFKCKATYPVLLKFLIHLNESPYHFTIGPFISLVPEVKNPKLVNATCVVQLLIKRTQQ